MPKNPYVHLKEVATKFVDKVINPKRVGAFHYTKGNSTADWISARVETAAALGYETVVYVQDGCLHFQYVEKRPTMAPWELR